MAWTNNAVLEWRTLLLPVAWLMTLTLPPISAESLYFSTPGDLSHPSGFYGGEINLTSTDSLLDTKELFEKGYSCLYFGQEKDEDLTIQSMSFDPISRDVLLAIIEPDERLTVATGPLCSMSEPCRNNSMKLVMYKVQKSHEKIGPFAYYNSTIYFLLTKKEELDHQTWKNEIHLRELSGCKDSFPVMANSAFSLEECSKLISTLSTETYITLAGISSLDSLLPMVAPRGSIPAFFTLLEHTSYTKSGNYDTLEVVLTYISSQGRPKSYHRQPVDTVFLNWDLPQLGGLTYNDGYLCWSAINVVQCAKWHPLNGLETPREVLTKDDVAHVCKVDIPNQSKLAEVISGVALADVQDTSLTLYFGCAISSGLYANNLGGAGLLQEKDAEGERKIYALSTNGDAMYFGTMFVTDDCNYTSSAWKVGFEALEKMLALSLFMFVVFM